MHIRTKGLFLYTERDRKIFIGCTHNDKMRMAVVICTNFVRIEECGILSIHEEELTVANNRR